MPVNLTPSNADTRTFKVAAIQAEPIWLDLQGSVTKTINIINEAAATALRCVILFCIGRTIVFTSSSCAVGFPEVFIPGHPWTPWAQNFAVAAPVLKAYQANSLPPHSAEMQRIQDAVKKAGVELCSDSRSAMLDRYILHSQHPQIFVGGWWPAFAPHEGNSPYIVSGEPSSRMTQMVAVEGSAFGIVRCQVVSEEGAKKMELTGSPWFKFPGGGFSTTYGPDGSQLVEPVDPGVEAILIDKVKLVADNQGNYSRHDLFHLAVHNKGSHKWHVSSYENPEERAVANSIHGEINNLAALELSSIDADKEANDVIPMSLQLKPFIRKLQSPPIRQPGVVSGKVQAAR
ncbi:hypothetical protein FRC09_006730 [Ceratobasidium sp. 395]|nr:hypothetical protein FRC09_006730 [Ceratobasidium sp. 395]